MHDCNSRPSCEGPCSDGACPCLPRGGCGGPGAVRRAAVRLASRRLRVWRRSLLQHVWLLRVRPRVLRPQLSEQLPWGSRRRHTGEGGPTVRCPGRRCSVRQWPLLQPVRVLRARHQILWCRLSEPVFGSVMTVKTKEVAVTPWRRSVPCACMFIFYYWDQASLVPPLFI